jgi:hypothetical protein
VVLLFFHGFYAADSPDHYLEPWESEDKSCIWPSTWLPEEFSGAQVFYVSYSALFGEDPEANTEMYIVGENLASYFLQTLAKYPIALLYWWVIALEVLSSSSSACILVTNSFGPQT